MNKHVLLCLVLISFVHAEQARVELGSPRSASPYLFGTNHNAFVSAKWWLEESFQSQLSELRPNAIRYPGGTTANYWDWRTGNNIPGARMVVPGVAHTIEVFAEGLPEGTGAIYCINIARPTPSTGVAHNADESVLIDQATLDLKIADILEAIAEWRIHIPGEPYIEIGNEFYEHAKGGKEGQGAIYSGKVGLYIDHADQVADAIRAAHPDAHIGIIGSTVRSKRSTGEWDKALYTAREKGHLDNVDAITWHWYSGPGRGITALTNAKDCENSVAQALSRVEMAGLRDVAGLPDDLDAWITEYNVWSRPGQSPLAGTWTNGLFAVAMSIASANLDERVALLNLHNLQGDEQWSQLQRSALAARTPLGQAMAELYAAGRGITSLTPIIAEGVGEVINGMPLLIGMKLSAANSERIFLLHSGSDALENVDLSAVLGDDGGWQMRSVYSAAPWKRETVEDLLIDTSVIKGRVDLPALSVNTITKIDE